MKGVPMAEYNVLNTICLLKGSDVAQMLNISRAFAYQLMREGKIPTVKIGRAVRVRVDDVLTYIDENVTGQNGSTNS
jgi:excisionase family DNA binding protein